MAFGNIVSIVGNVTRDPEVRFTPAGTPVCSFGVAWNRRYERNGEQVEDTSFFEVICWSALGENVAQSIPKGARVVVTGRLDQRSFTNKDGESRQAVEIVADDVAPSLRWATAEITRNERPANDGATRPQSAGAAAPHPGEEPF